MDCASVFCPSSDLYCVQFKVLLSARRVRKERSVSHPARQLLNFNIFTFIRNYQFVPAPPRYTLLVSTHKHHPAMFGWHRPFLFSTIRVHAQHSRAARALWIRLLFGPTMANMAIKMHGTFSGTFTMVWVWSRDRIASYSTTTLGRFLCRYC